eukprot:TRINITY_DN8636_c0_g1_i3.p1 TRINITY_DN8636_c0_g1~~TRINITY_DN8636_c0_g1_i3.p1  ORF type:complete len:100 (+),score=10.80 TRINITY_DN8636_c0_g1_i3:201-500(+)
MEKQRFTVEKARQWLDQMTNKVPLEALEGLPVGFYEALFVQSLQIDVVEPGRILCSLEVPSCLIVSCSALPAFYIFRILPFPCCLFKITETSGTLDQIM